MLESWLHKIAANFLYSNNGINDEMHNHFPWRYFLANRLGRILGKIIQDEVFNLFRHLKQQISTAEKLR